VTQAADAMLKKGHTMDMDAPWLLLLSLRGSFLRHGRHGSPENSKDLRIFSQGVLKNVMFIHVLSTPG
jgi:hypothetical protein